MYEKRCVVGTFSFLRKIRFRKFSKDLVAKFDGGLFL